MNSVFRNLLLHVVWLSAWTGWAASGYAQIDERTRVNVIAQAIPAAVCVFGPGEMGGGSGVVISPDGYALTNFHVIESCEAFLKCGMSDGNLYDAVIVGVDPTGDVALIRLIGRSDFPFAVLANSDQVRVGDECFSVGNPFLLATDFQPSVSWGIVSGTHRYQYPSGTLLEYADCIQTDASINPGNSGGPLFDAEAQLIGINGRGSFEKRGRVNVGVGYAISSNQIRNFMDHLKSGRIVDHASLGALVGANREGQTIITELLDSSDAYRKGIRLNDELLQFDDRTIKSPNQFKNALGIYPKGWKIPMRLRRDRTEFEVLVRLAGVHSEPELIEKVQGKITSKEKPDSAPEVPATRKDNGADPDKFDSSVSEWFESRRGFANYHFNRLETGRVWDRFLTTQPPRTNKTWQLAGTDNLQRPIRIVLSDRTSGIERAGEAFVLNPEDDVAGQMEATDLKAVLSGLHLWRKFQLEGKNFGRTYYFGGVPANGSSGVHDSLISLYESARFYSLFEKASGQLVECDFVDEQDASVCTMKFSRFQMLEDENWPMSVEVEFNGGEATRIDFQSIKVGMDNR